MSQDVLMSILSPIIAILGAFSSWMVVLLKTRTKSLQKQLLKKYDVDYHDYCIYYDGKYIDLATCKLIKKTDAINEILFVNHYDDNMKGDVE